MVHPFLSTRGKKVHNGKMVHGKKVHGKMVHHASLGTVVCYVGIGLQLSKIAVGPIVSKSLLQAWF